MGDWQPIETAPRDGTRVLAWRNWTMPPKWEVGVVWFEFGGWWTTDEQTGGGAEAEVTHWMPLPAPPGETSDDA